MRTLICSLLAIIGLTSIQAAEVTLDLSGAVFGTGQEIHLDSNAERLDPSFAYNYRVEGSIRGTGLLANIVPTGSNIEDLLDQIGTGTVNPLSGVVANPSGRLPINVINQSFDGPIPIPGVAVTPSVSITMKGGVTANGTIRFDVTNVNLSVPIVGSLGTIVFEPGSRLIVGNAYTGFAGTYNTVIETPVFATSRLGLLKVTLAPTGALTGSLKLGGRNYPIKSTLGTTQVTKDIKLPAVGLLLRLSVDFNTPAVLTADLRNDAGSLATFAMNRSLYTDGPPLVRSGAYTIVIQPPKPVAGDVPSVIPAAPGFLLAKITANGNVTFAGVLCDGKAVTSAGALTTGDTVPFYAGLNAGRGALFGTVNLHEQDEPDDITGTLRWLKPIAAGEKIFIAGFDRDCELLGSRFIKPDAGQRIMNFTTGFFSITAGNLASPANPAAVLGSDNRFTTDPSLKASIAVASGLFKGSFRPATGKIPGGFRGVILQKQAKASGFFIGKPAPGDLPEAGAVELMPAL